eukprot:TRINITY_DN7957_c0_g2_i1.p1 TRINITY_DN7957_c0_g2~~TRINITY_DN7957_c0_g2_i1.p1  ORF type:complete len:225 (+),score=43.50 TRINITY_DN7957_c0_g2_i1:180-854(+)
MAGVKDEDLFKSNAETKFNSTLLTSILNIDSDDETEELKYNKDVINELLQSDDEASPKEAATPSQTQADPLGVVEECEGRGKFRDVCELVQRLKGKYEGEVARMKYNNHMKANVDKENPAEKPNCIAVRVQLTALDARRRYLHRELAGDHKIPERSKEATVPAGRQGPAKAGADLLGHSRYRGPHSCRHESGLYFFVGCKEAESCVVFELGTRFPYTCCQVCER